MTVPAAAPDNPPVVTVTNKTVAAGTVIPLSQLFSYSDPDAGDSVTAFAVRDRTLGGGYLTLNGAHQTDGAVFDEIPISQIGQWAFVAGPRPARPTRSASMRMTATASSVRRLPRR